MAYSKGTPNSHRKAIEQGEQAMHIWKDGSFSDEQKYSPKIYRQITKLRYLLADLYSLDVRNTMPDAWEMIEDFKNDNEQFRNEEQRQRLISESDLRRFKKLEKEVIVRFKIPYTSFINCGQ